MPADSRSWGCPTPGLDPRAPGRAPTLLPTPGSRLSPGPHGPGHPARRSSDHQEQPGRPHRGDRPTAPCPPPWLTSPLHSGAAPARAPGLPRTEPQPGGGALAFRELALRHGRDPAGPQGTLVATPPPSAGP